MNGVTEASEQGDAREQEDDQISRRLVEMQDSILLPIKEDLSEWINGLTGVEITAETFMNVLDSGIVLCNIAKCIEKRAQEYAAQGKLTEPLPDVKLRCNQRAVSGTWFARDNTSNFLSWCRAYGMTDETMFDSEDLVSHKQEKPVVNCVLELARIGWRYGIEPPSLIRMEKEIEKEVQECKPPPFTPKPVEIVEDKDKKPATCLPKPAEVKKQKVKRNPDKFDLDKEVRRVAAKYNCQDHVKRIREGVYDIYGRRVFIRLLHGKHLMVRVGGGWDTLDNYLQHHDPVHVYEHRFSGVFNNSEKYLVIRSKYKSS